MKQELQLGSVLSDPECTIHSSMTKSTSYETEMPNSVAGVNVHTGSAFHDKPLATTAVQKAQNSWTAGTELVKDERRAMKCEYVVWLLLSDLHNGIAPCWWIWVKWRVQNGLKSSIPVGLGTTWSRSKLSGLLQERLKTMYSWVFWTLIRDAIQWCLVSF